MILVRAFHKEVNHATQTPEKYHAIVEEERGGEEQAAVDEGASVNEVEQEDQVGGKKGKKDKKKDKKKEKKNRKNKESSK